MTQKFDDLVATDYIDTGIMTLKERDMTALTAMSGENDPTDPPEDAVYDNTTSGVLKLNGNTLIDYKNGYLNSTILATNYQPLNSVLTSISGATLNPSCIVTTDGTVSSVSNYGTLIPNMSTPPGTGNLSTRNSIYTGDVGNGVVTSAKLDSSIALVSPFKLGSIIYSFTGGNRSGFLKLTENATMGSSLSNATYRRDDYYNLFALLWSSSSAVLYGLDGQVTQKGSSAYDDFTSNKAILLPTAGGDVEPVTFTYTGAAQTYAVPSMIKKLEIDCVAAGGGGRTDALKSKGGRVQCTLSVRPNDVISVYVGGRGGANSSGWNGGGTGRTYYSNGIGYGGGGASDLRLNGSSLADRCVVAGGGGGGAYMSGDYGIEYQMYGGNGGGLTGQDGQKLYDITGYRLAKGGTQDGGGIGAGGNSQYGGNGSSGTGGDGARIGGGGGGGYYGGGGGSALYTGAGGSSYTDPNLCTDVVHTQGYENATGNGWITITPIGYTPNAYIKY